MTEVKPLETREDGASMESQTIRVNKKTIDEIRMLADRAETTMTAIVEAADSGVRREDSGRNSMRAMPH